MVEEIIVLKNGYAYTTYAPSFEELFQNLGTAIENVVQVTGRTIKTNEIRQGKEKLTSGYAL